MIYCLEDDISIRELIIYTLEKSGFSVKGFAEYQDFMSELQTKKPDLILLDIMLKDKSGIDILKELKESREYRDIPVILETAKTSESDMVSGLDAGADDYLRKPFGMMEMVSRIKAVLRRTNRNVAEMITFHEIEVDKLRRTVKVNGETVELTLKEYELLVYLLSNRDVVLTREQLLENVWDHSFLGESRTIDVHIGTLRNKLGDAKEYIQTIHGVGYRLRDFNGK